MLSEEGYLRDQGKYNIAPSIQVVKGVIEVVVVFYWLLIINVDVYDILNNEITSRLEFIVSIVKYHMHNQGQRLSDISKRDKELKNSISDLKKRLNAPHQIE